MDKKGYLFCLRGGVRAALREDLGRTGDITSRAMIARGRVGRAVIVARQGGVIAGLDAAREAFAQVDRRVRFTPAIRDGALVRAGRVVARIRGPLRSILTAERTALNFLQQLSGVATLTRAFVERVRGTRARIYDTRKTAPGLRELQKRAVAAGGGRNHRRGLFDAALIKENHLAAAGPAARLAERIRRLRHRARFVQIEAQSLEEARRFAALPVDSILLDNFSPSGLARAVRAVRSVNRRVRLEASGGVRLSNVRRIARAGVDRISVGALTHSAPALDLSLDLELP
jgi:nicotinate-nucleotide pyrophosphorylase (carboxylating)